ncbi:MAG: terminase [Thermoleophilia bacterium]
MSTAVAGAQAPRILHVPPYVSSAGDEAVELAQMAGLDLDLWQQLVLTHMLGERDDGKWAAFEVGLNVPRQNGKGGLLEARELAGLFLLGERLIVHTAHEFATADEAFRRLLMLIEQTPELDQRVMSVSRAHGKEGIELRGRQRIRFRTRTKGGGRGFTGDCLIYDECMILDDAAVGATLPTLSARPNPQVVYTGSAVDQLVHDHGVVWARIRERGLRGTDPALAYFEFSAPGEDEEGKPIDPSEVPEEVAGNPEAWARANPALGVRITEEHVARERRSMDARTFAVERLGIGDWPATDPTAGGAIDFAVWKELVDEGSAAIDPVTFAFDVSPDRSVSTIAAAGARPGGGYHVEVVDRRSGTGWLAGRLAELEERYSPTGILFAERSPAAAVAHAITATGFPLTAVPSQEFVDACGALVDHVAQRAVHHRGHPELDLAVRAAVTRPLGDSWAWSRARSKVDITPLVAATIALHGSSQPAPTPFIL